MVSLTFFGGVNEIGGNKILVEDKHTKIFLDFGQSFSLLDDFFVDWLQPRARFGLKDYFALDLMPKLKGLYSKQALNSTNLDYQEPDYDGIFISHPHFDHTAHLQFLDPNIPIFLGETTKTILDATQCSTNSFFFNEQDEEKKDGTKIEKNDLHLFRTKKSIKLDSLEITPIHVDHSVPGAYGFIIETSEGTIVYSGDLRQHGAKPQMTKDFIEEAKETDPELLIIEGTRVSDKETRKNHTEKIVQEGSLKVAKDYKGILLGMRYPKDLDRFKTFYQTAKETNKTLVISLKTAHLLNALKNDKPLGLPAINDPNIKIYVRQMLRYDKWQKEIMENETCVDAQWVKKHQNSILWELDFTQMNELIDIKPERGACIHSMSEPFEEDPSSQLQDEVLKNWLERFHLPHHQLHASGHASQNEIFEMIETIKPKKVAPVHTHHAELFPKQVELVKGKRIEL